MTIPNYQSLMLPVLKFSADGEVRLKNLIEHLANELKLTESERTELLPSGQQTVFVNRVGWAKTYLSKAGLIIATRRGHFCISELGKKVLNSNPPEINLGFLMQFEQFRQFKQKTSEIEEQEHEKQTEKNYTPDEIMRSAHNKVEAALAQELLERILAAPPDFFERLIIKLLISMGYGGSTKEAGRALGQSGDNGIDGVIDQDALGLDQVYIQAKRYAIGNNIGSSAIRDFFGSLDRHKASKGLFVTTSTFSSSAKETAEFLSKRIVLIDGKQLAKLMIRYNVACRIEEILYIKKIDEEFFE